MLFGIANQMLAAIALCVATSIIVKSGKARYAWVTALPLTWLVVITSTAAYEKIFSDDVRVGFFAAANHLSAQLSSGVLSAERAVIAPRLIFNQHLDAYLTMFFVFVLWVVVIDMINISRRYLQGKKVLASSETPYVKTALE